MHQERLLDDTRDEARTTGVSRRQILQATTALLGGVALAGGDGLLAFAFDEGARAQAMAAGAGGFTAADIALLDEIAENILPETTTPGAKAAKTGAFMALMVTDAYSDQNREIFRDGMRRLDEACRAKHGVGFMEATPPQRLVVLEILDREQRTAFEEATATRSRAPAPEPPEPDAAPAHYFRLMKELALLGFFTSEIGYTRAMRYVESPGRFDPCVPHAPGDRTWAAHA